MPRREGEGTIIPRWLRDAWRRKARGEGTVSPADGARSSIEEIVPYQVLTKFEELTFQVIDRGFDRYSSDAILHRVRWHEQVERGNREFRCNNNWTAGLARWFMEKYPEHAGFFELRVRKSLGEESEQ